MAKAISRALLMPRYLRVFVLGFMSTLFFLLISPWYLAKNLWAVFDQDKNDDFKWEWSQKLYAEVLTTVDAALKTMMPEADSFEEDIRMLTDLQLKEVSEKSNLDLNPDYDQVFRFYVGKKNGQILGYAVKDSAPGKWGVINYMVCLRPSGEVLDVLVLEYQEKRGRPVAKRRFLKQFVGKTARDDIRVMRDIKGVTGASISSNSMSNGVRKIVNVFQSLYLSKP